jgi:hypothetical protein
MTDIRETCYKQRDIKRCPIFVPLIYIGYLRMLAIHGLWQDDLRIGKDLEEGCLGLVEVLSWHLLASLYANIEAFEGN